KAATVTADNHTKTYGAGDPGFTFQVSGLETGDGLTGVSCAVSGAHSNAGSYSISCSGNTNANYAPTYAAGTLTVTAKAATVTAVNSGKTYGGAEPTLTATATGI